MSEFVRLVRLLLCLDDLLLRGVVVVVDEGAAVVVQGAQQRGVPTWSCPYRSLLCIYTDASSLFQAIEGVCNLIRLRPSSSTSCKDSMLV